MSSVQSILDTPLAQSTDLVLYTPHAQRTSDLLDTSDSKSRESSDSTTRDIRVQIKTALLFGILYKDICATLNITRN